MSKFISHKDNSRINWGKTINGSENRDRNDIELGCMLRIADATEAMAKDHITLMHDRDMYRWRYEAELSRSNALKLSNNALRGAITKLKKKLAAKDQP